MLFLQEFQLALQLDSTHLILIEIQALILLDRQHRSNFRLDRVRRRRRQLDIHAPVEHRCRHHKNDQQHQHDIDQGNNIDLRHEAALACFEDHPFVPIEAGLAFGAINVRSSTVTVSMRNAVPRIRDRK